MTPNRFLSCDWGTTSFRLRLASRTDGRVLAGIERHEGARAIHDRLLAQGKAADPDARDAAFRSVLASAIADLAGLTPGGLADEPVVVSGMASSTVGWRELPYAHTPSPLDGSGLRIEGLGTVSHDEGPARHPVWLVSGLSTGTDLMRGEECELFGIFASPEWERFRRDAIVVLPGTHSKHVRVQDEAVVDIRTHMTGELLELLSTRSLLSVSVDWPPPLPPPAGPEAKGEAGKAAEAWRREFDAGVERARDAGMARGLFGVRVRSVLGNTARSANATFLAGLLVGGELLDLLAWEPRTSPVVLAASARFEQPYRRALEVLGAGTRVVEVAPAELVQATVQAHALVLDRIAPGEGGIRGD